MNDPKPSAAELRGGAYERPQLGEIVLPDDFKLNATCQTWAACDKGYYNNCNYPVSYSG